MCQIAEHLNNLQASVLAATLGKCCASNAWVEAMQRAAPFAHDQQVEQQAVDIWQSLSPADWLEAFAAHPRIGDVASLRAKYAATEKWATSEQSGVASASDATLQRLAQQNASYEDKFGHLFIVCASGKSAEEMLALLEKRISNSPAEELPIAAAEQLKITLIRLRKISS